MREDEKGVSGARDFLRSLPEHTLLSLCQTVTQSIIKASTKEEAVTAILLHSHDLDSILRRKVMTRDLLFQYLHDKGVSVTPATVKQDLVNKTLSLWLECGNRQTCVQIQNVQQDLAPVNTDAQLQMMAQQFTGWFYSLLKECGLHAENFWENSEVLLTLKSSNGEDKTTLFSGVQQVLNAFSQLVQGYGVTLAPNSMGGCSAEMDPHGLVLITCNGTVYVKSNCSGVFQQMFALTADPFSQGDWRIKRTKLDVRLEAHGLSFHGMSALEGNNLTVDRV